MRSVTTEKPTEATAPRPTEASARAARNAGYDPEKATQAVPADHRTVPVMSSRLRSVRSPRYAQPTAASAVIR